MKRFALIRLFFIFTTGLVLGMIFTHPAFAAFPTDWNYRKSHVINTAAGAGTDYQVRITAYYGAGADSGENVYLNANCRTDFGDIRFVSSDGITELSYWRETVTAGASAVFWVKVADNLGAANRTVYVYYGNAVATTTSDGGSTFIFFDDFDVDLSKWVVEKTLDGSFITINAAQSYVRCGGGITSGTYGHTSLGSSPAYSGFGNGAIELRLKQSANALAEIGYRGDFGANTGYKGRYDCRIGDESPHMKPSYFGWQPFGTAVTRFGIGTDTWYRGTVAATTSGGTFTHRIFRNGVQVSSATDNEYPGPGEIALQNHYGSYTDYDWVAIRKYVSPEPVHNAWGAETPVQADVSATMSVALRIDADADQQITPGDTLEYNVKILNTGNADAIGATLTDPIPAFLTYVNGSVAATAGSASYNSGTGEIEWTGDAAMGVLIVITFDVTVDGGTPMLTVISNQGTINFDSDNDGVNDRSEFTDGDPYTAGEQTTNFTIGYPAHGLGAKIATDLNGGSLEPGDTLEYTINLINQSGFDGNGIEFTDPIPDYTTYVAGSVTTTTGTVVTETPTLYINDISIPAHTDITITFRVKLDNPMPSGVIEISNQAVVFYDSNTDGLNDTYQSTDGDPATPGNQPTVSPVFHSTISGTVFDDNGNGGGMAGNGVQDGAEPGISGVTVELYDSIPVLLYGATTDGNGNYSFTGLPSGDYTAVETDPAYYVSTTPNSVTITAPSGGGAFVNFGDQPNGYADLEISKICATLFADGTNQLTHLITITNNGPDAATNAVFTDDLTALAAAGLGNINYTEDGGPLTPWPVSNTLPWGSMASGESHAIRIYANVATTFVPVENTATAASDIFDPNTFDNTSSCANVVSTVGRGAMEFLPVSNTHVSIASNASLELTATGTLEAWIYPTEFEADAGIIMKGTGAACYGIGLGGGGAGDVFSAGSSRNIGFVLYDATGIKYLLTADSYTLSANRWHHIACVWNLGASPQMAIYINGIKKAESSPGIPDVRTNAEDLIIGFQNITSGNYTGVIDEVRVWDAARIQTRIQDTMCHKVTGGEPDYAGLMGNWRFDEDSGPVCNDASVNGNFGHTNTSRVCSSAPIGNASAHDYTGSAAADFEILNFASSHGDSMTVTGDGGDWNSTLDSCLHVYRVDDAQANVGRPFLWKDPGTALHYWGVFKSGGANPTYKAVYTYTGYPAVGNEESLELAYRNNNCESWKDANATIDMDNDTLTRSGLSGTEFLLGQNVDPRNAIQFDGTDDYVDIADDASLNLTTEGTLEAWIYITAYRTDAGIINKGDTTDGYSLHADGTTGNRIVLTLYNGGASDSVTSAVTLNTATWYHIAATWDGVDMNLYINGVQDTGSKPSAQASGDTTGADPTIGAGGNYFQGLIDEVRVWDAARSRNRIRDTMCQKITSSESDYADLMGYWRFDEETGSVICPDYSGHGNIGIMTGFGADGSDAIRNARVCSSAPIGDDSVCVLRRRCCFSGFHATGPFRRRLRIGNGKCGKLARRLFRSSCIPAG